jgi:hypothetical protein
MKKVFLFVLITIFAWQLPTLAQNVPARNAKKDSVYFSKPYPFILPIMGSKVHNLGFKTTFSYGSYDQCFSC